MRMYILVREKAPVGWGVNGVAHAALMCYLKYHKHPDMVKWLRHFNKVTCLVSDEEYNLAKTAGDYVEFIENDLDNMPLVLAFKPRDKWPCYFKGFSLYS